MSAGQNESQFSGESGFLSSVVEIEMEYWHNDIAGTREVLVKLGCTSAQAEAAIGCYLCRRFAQEK